MKAPRPAQSSTFDRKRVNLEEDYPSAVSNKC